MKRVPITYWYGPVGYDDGIDMATRGYIRSLLSVGYEHIVLNARGGKVSYLNREDIADLVDLMGFPKHLHKETVRVQAGDPRIGTPWPHLPDEVVCDQAPSHAPEGYVGMRWKNIIQEGEVDQDYYREHPATLDWEPVTELAVAHFDPGELSRARDGLARDSGGTVPIVGITAWEPDRVPKALAQQLSDLSALIVPSLHTREAFIRSGLSCPIYVVPHALSISPLSDAEYEESTQRRPNKYLFYSIGSNIPRKNLCGVIEAYCRAFGPEFKGVGLIIKTRGNPPSLKRLYEDGVKVSGCSTWPRIAIYGDSWPSSSIRRLHLTSDCWVDATRGEGFGLCQQEAAALGNQIVTTSWGAQAEVAATVDQSGLVDWSRLVLCSLVPVDESMVALGPYDSSQQWAESDMGDLVDAMRSAREAYSGKRIAQARRVASEYSLERIGGLLRGVLRGVVDREVG